MRRSQCTGACAGTWTRPCARRCCMPSIAVGSPKRMHGRPEIAAWRGASPLNANCAPRWWQRNVSEGAASAAELAGLWSEKDISMKPLTGST